MCTSTSSRLTVGFELRREKLCLRGAASEESWLKGRVVFLGEGWFVSDSGCTKAYHKINKNIFEL